MHFDDLLKVLGEFGRYQKIRLFLVCLVSIVCAWHSLNMVFIGAKPDFWCRKPDLNYSAEPWTDFNKTELNAVFGPSEEDSCKMHNISEILYLVNEMNYTFSELNRSRENRTMLNCAHGYEYSTELYASTIVSEWDLVCEKDWMRTTAKTLFFFGRLLGAVGFGQLSDKFGRRPIFFLGLLTLLIVGCVTAAAPNVYVFYVLYILQGAAQTGLFLVAFTMCTELVGPSYRLLASFLSQSFYSIGYMTLAVIAYGIGEWRYLEVAITVPVVLFATYWWFLPESIRWLLSQDREEEARAILTKVAETNNVKLPDDALHELKGKEEKTDDRKYSILDLVRTLKMAKLSLNIWFNWFVNALVYYGLSLGTDNLGGSPYINFCIAGAVEIPAYILCVLFLNKAGRRWPLSGTMLFGGAACIASGFIPKHITWLKITLAMLGKFGITASYGIIYLMAAEIFPTVVRNIGMGMSSMSARIGGMVAPQILDLSLIWGPLSVVIFGVLSIIAGGLALLLPETAGRPLPQTIEEVHGRRKGEDVLEIEANDVILKNEVPRENHVQENKQLTDDSRL